MDRAEPDAPGTRPILLPAGDGTRHDLVPVQPAGDELMTLDLSGAQLVRFPEEQQRPERTSLLQVAGLAFEVGPSRPIDGWVAGVCIADRPLDTEATTAVSLNADLAGVSDGLAVPREVCERRVGPTNDGRVNHTDRIQLETLITCVPWPPQPFAAPSEGRIRRAGQSVA